MRDFICDVFNDPPPSLTPPPLDFLLNKHLKLGYVKRSGKLKYLHHVAAVMAVFCDFQFLILNADDELTTQTHTKHTTTQTHTAHKHTQNK